MAEAVELLAAEGHTGGGGSDAVAAVISMAPDEVTLFWVHGMLLLVAVPLLATQKMRSGGLLSVDGLSLQEGATLAAFQKRYLAPYLLATFADWIQGPYQFKVYLTYGLTEGQIGILYIAGFGSSLVLGTWVAAAADRMGRRAGCLLYCACCGLSCLTKNSPVYGVLLIGRVLGGIAASLLFATYEAWCVTAARAADLPHRCIGAVFTNAGFLNGMVAIVASLVGHFLVAASGGNFVAPFNFAPLVLFIAAALLLRWEENYGTPSAEGDAPASDGLSEGLRLICSEVQLPLLGLIGSLFDAALYIFIFLWTLGLEARSTTAAALPHGIAFAVFMGWCMTGALVCEAALAPGDGRATPGGRATVVVGALLWLAILGLSPPLVRGSGFTLVFCGFCAFEFCAGGYQPAVALLRAVHLKEEGRAAATAIFRMPTNLAVCLVLLKTEELSEASKFGLCVGLLLLAAASHALFVRKVRVMHAGSSPSAAPKGSPAVLHFGSHPLAGRLSSSGPATRKQCRVAGSPCGQDPRENPDVQSDSSECRRDLSAEPGWVL
eukprot:TRINITY_DN12311_c0_g1_i1.p1 TRINITY_DN12311_c0_g1~~TRINITY_DN12311_c0_g1_i1.p1  ORF type:complete len:589 (+),score=144.12 TRINITY_DN12311_c0_g1_i1:119-1768(+)